ncbi:cohesin domain-containing protein [Isoptericola haloaureus]|uniref:Cohesin domain-containing protein n=1 Tax=Isoptericola haloaureus TaxID=1542902 RepID=A0ABU7Z2E6_9MICO
MPTTPARTRRTRLLAGAGVLGLALCAGGAAVATADDADPSFAVEVSDPAPSPGDTVEVTVTASDVVDLYAYELTLEYDRSDLTYVAGSATTPEGGYSDTSAGRGSLEVVHTRLGTSPAPSGDLELVTVTFRTHGPGEAGVDLASAVTVTTDRETTVVDDAAAATLTVATPGRG